MDAKHVNAFIEAALSILETKVQTKAEIPDVIMGGQHTLNHMFGRPLTAMSYQTDNGDFTMEFCFEE